MLLEMYPDHEILFLARDAELNYDFARLMTSDQPNDSRRLHLVNVSKLSESSKGVQAYLKQFGLDPDHLPPNKNYLLVDTGFQGTIPNSIRSRFNSRQREQIRVQLTCSANPEYPSSRVVIASINPFAARMNPRSAHGFMINYEDLHHYTDSAWIRKI